MDKTDQTQQRGKDAMPTTDPAARGTNAPRADIFWQEVQVNVAARAKQKCQEPFVIWFTGLSGAGKSTIATRLERELYISGRHTYLLDGDNLRHGLNRDLGFDDGARRENVRRVAEVAALMVDAGLIVLVSLISPFRAERSMARGLVGDGRFVEIFVDAPVGECEARDPKGLYRKVREGGITNFTGIHSPYEAPERPDLHLITSRSSPEDSVQKILKYLTDRGLAEPPEAGRR